MQNNERDILIALQKEKDDRVLESLFRIDAIFKTKQFEFDAKIQELFSISENLKNLEARFTQSETEKNILVQEIHNQREKFFEEYKIAQAEVVTLVGQVNEKEFLIRERDALVHEKNSVIAECDIAIHEYQKKLDVLLQKLEEEKSVYEHTIHDLEEKISTRDAHILDLKLTITDKELYIQSLVDQNNEIIISKDVEIARIISEKDTYIRTVVEQKNIEINTIVEQKNTEIATIQASKFWKLRDFYMRLKWMIMNPLKSIKKHIWSDMRTYADIKWAIQNPAEFFRKYVDYKKQLPIKTNQEYIQEVLSFKFNDIKPIEFKKSIKPKASIIIPVFNKWQFTYHCLDALKKNTKGVHFEIIVVDNNSTDETSSMLANVRNITYVKNNTNFGFSKACNQGASYAQGEYLVFLNNDTIPLHGWLSVLVKELDTNTKAGIVGSKLLYPDNTVQHAGIYFRDDLYPEHIHRGVQSNDERVNFKKAFHALTGACIAIRKDMFATLTGFDETYRNSYEDVDLCLRVGVLGYLVVYCPESCLYHYESISEGRNDHNVSNAEIFMSRWGESSIVRSGKEPQYFSIPKSSLFSMLSIEKIKYVANHFIKAVRNDGFIGAFVRSKNFILYGKGFLKKNIQTPVIGEDVDQVGLYEKPIHVSTHADFTKNILVIDAFTLTPDQDAGSLYMFNSLKILINLGLHVTFIPSCNLSYVKGYTKALEEIGVECMYTPYISSVEDFIQKRGSEYGYIMLTRVTTAEQYIDYIKSVCSHAKIIFNTVDVHHLRLLRQAKQENNSSLQAFAEKLKITEIDAMKKSDKTIVVSSAEKEIIKKEVPGTSVDVIHLILDMSQYSRRKKTPKNHDILFIGGFNHMPNVDAVQWFCESILPLVIQKIPTVRFHIVGSGMPKSIEDLASDHIIVHGYVKDPKDLIQSVRCTIAPIRFGAGQNGKIIQSLAFGVPCITTTLGAEGINATANKEVVVADTAQDFAIAVCKIFRNDELCDILSKNGYRFVEKKFSVQHATQCYEKLFQDISHGIPVIKNSNEANTKMISKLAILPRILFDCTFIFYNPNYNTGIQRVVRKIIGHVLQHIKTHEVVIVVWKDNKLYRVRYNGHDSVSPNLNLSSGTLEQFMVRVGDTLVVIDAHWDFNIFLRISELKSKGIKVVGVIYDLILMKYPQYNNEDFVSIFKQWIDGMIRVSDGILAISKDVQSQVEAYSQKLLGEHKSKEKWYDHFYLGNNIDDIHSQGVIRNIVKNIFQGAQPVFLMVSTLEPRKNHLYLIDVFDILWAQNIDVKLCFIGRFGWQYERLAERISNHKEFGKRFFHIQDATDSELVFCYTHATRLVFPSHAEGFGLPIVEALQHGLPVLASDIPVFREIGSGHVLYFDQNQPQSLVGLITQITENKLARPKSQNKWSWISWEESSKQFIQKIIKHLSH